MSVHHCWQQVDGPQVEEGGAPGKFPPGGSAGKHMGSGATASQVPKPSTCILSAVSHCARWCILHHPLVYNLATRTTDTSLHIPSGATLASCTPLVHILSCPFPHIHPINHTHKLSPAFKANFRTISHGLTPCTLCLTWTWKISPFWFSRSARSMPGPRGFAPIIRHQSTPPNCSTGSMPMLTCGHGMSRGKADQASCTGQGCCEQTGGTSLWTCSRQTQQRSPTRIRNNVCILAQRGPPTDNP